MMGIFLGLPLFLVLALTSTISASSFGDVTMIIRVCLLAFFLEIAFLGLETGLAASPSWGGANAASLGASFSPILGFS
jgi:hypothetical protein